MAARSTVLPADPPWEAVWRCYRMMLEVIANDRARREVFVMVGLGQWYRNVIAGAAVELAIGSERFRPDYHELAPAEAAAVLGDYERATGFGSDRPDRVEPAGWLALRRVARRRVIVLFVSGRYSRFRPAS